MPRLSGGKRGPAFLLLPLPTDPRAPPHPHSKQFVFCVSNSFRRHNGWFFKLFRLVFWLWSCANCFSVFFNLKFVMNLVIFRAQVQSKCINCHYLVSATILSCVYWFALILNTELSNMSDLNIISVLTSCSFVHNFKQPYSDLSEILRAFHHLFIWTQLANRLFYLATLWK